MRKRAAGPRTKPKTRRRCGKPPSPSRAEIVTGVAYRLRLVAFSSICALLPNSSVDLEGRGFPKESTHEAQS